MKVQTFSKLVLAKGRVLSRMYLSDTETMSGARLKISIFISMVTFLLAQMLVPHIASAELSSITPNARSVNFKSRAICPSGSSTFLCGNQAQCIQSTKMVRYQNRNIPWKNACKMATQEFTKKLKTLKAKGISLDLKDQELLKLSEETLQKEGELSPSQIPKWNQEILQAQLADANFNNSDSFKSSNASSASPHDSGNKNKNLGSKNLAEQNSDINNTNPDAPIYAPPVGNQKNTITGQPSQASGNASASARAEVNIQTTPYSENRNPASADLFGTVPHTDENAANANLAQNQNATNLNSANTPEFQPSTQPRTENPLPTNSNLGPISSETGLPIYAPPQISSGADTTSWLPWLNDGGESSGSGADSGPSPREEHKRCENPLEWHRLTDIKFCQCSKENLVKTDLLKRCFSLGILNPSDNDKSITENLEQCKSVIEKINGADWSKNGDSLLQKYNDAKFREALLKALVEKNEKIKCPMAQSEIAQMCSQLIASNGFVSLFRKYSDIGPIEQHLFVSQMRKLQKGYTYSKGQNYLGGVDSLPNGGKRYFCGEIAKGLRPTKADEQNAVGAAFEVLSRVSAQQLKKLQGSEKYKSFMKDNNVGGAELTVQQLQQDEKQNVQKLKNLIGKFSQEICPKEISSSKLTGKEKSKDLKSILRDTQINIDGLKSSVDSAIGSPGISKNTQLKNWNLTQAKVEQRDAKYQLLSNWLPDYERDRACQFTEAVCSGNVCPASASPFFKKNKSSNGTN